MSILKALYQLFNVLMERKVLSWEFFAGQFDTVIANIQGQQQPQNHQQLLLAQQQQQPAAAHPCATVPPPPSNGNSNMEPPPHHHPHHYQQHHPDGKGWRVKSSSGLDSVRSLVHCQKYPYKRTVSAPAGIALAVRPMLAPSQLVAPAAVLAAAALNSANTVKLAAEEDKRHYKRQQSAPNMRHKVSKGGSEVKGKIFFFFC
jgi:hypothetical protein